jgi:hypothetical protein
VARLPPGLNLLFRTTTTTPARLSVETEDAPDERSALAAEVSRLEQRLELLRDAIQTLEAAPENRTAAPSEAA